MKQSKATIVVALAAAFFLISPATALATSPACTEYCYEQIPEEKPDKPKQTANNNQGNTGNETSGSAGYSGGSTGSGGGTSTGSGVTAVPSDPDNGNGNKKNAQKNENDKQAGAGQGDKERDKLASTLERSKAAAGDTDSGSSSGTTLLIVLLGVTALVVIVAWRAGVGSGAMLRIGALGVVLIVLVFVGTGTAIAKRASVPKDFFGMITQTEFRDVDAEKISRGGNEVMRFPLQWPGVQPNDANHFQWGLVDQFVATASKSGMKVLPFVYDSPSWVANGPTILPVKNAHQKQAWKNFLAAAVDRYGPQGEFWDEHGPDSADPVPKTPIRTWQIWNEPNFHYFAKPVSPNNYATLLKLASSSIKSRDARAKIMFAGLYGSPKDIAKRAMKSWKFLARVYARGGKRDFDIAAVHPYTPNTRQLKLLMNEVRKVMIRNGDRAGKLAITEVGWGSDRRSVFGMGSKAKQAKQLKSAYNYLIGARRKLNLNSVYWFAYQDVRNSVQTCVFCYGIGLMEATPKNKPQAPPKPKPAWNQYVKFTGGKR